MQKPESPPLLTHFRMGAHSTNYSVLNGNGTGGNAGGNGTAELRPQHQVLPLKRFNCVGWAQIVAWKSSGGVRSEFAKIEEIC